MDTKKIKVNAWRGSDSINTLNYAALPGDKHLKKLPKNVEYVGPFLDFDGITLFIDECFDSENTHIIDKCKSKYKVAWIHEPRPLHNLQNNRLKTLEGMLDKFDFVMTYDEYLLDNYPEKCVYCIDNCFWISDDMIKIHKKSKLASMIYSWKSDTEGHKLRHIIASTDGLDLYGSGCGRIIEFKEEGLADYYFSITIENSKSKYYFTEKILDCFACGTIPIYWGCKNIGDYFDERGIISFDSISDLPQIFEKIGDMDYIESLQPYVRNNFEIVKQYHRYEDWIKENIFDKFLGEQSGKDIFKN